MNTQEKISQLLNELIAEGEDVLRSIWESNKNYLDGHRDTFVDLRQFKTWQARCKFLASLLGKMGKSWESVLAQPDV